MAWFFSETEIKSDTYLLEGGNAKHAQVLRLRKGEAVTVVTPLGEQCECEVQDGALLKVVSRKPCQNEPDVFVTLYQALPKGDKMDYIVQKCVELGVSRIVPMISARCVSRPDEKSLRKKRERWQKIALQAAMQSRRGIIPEVADCVSFSTAAELTKQNDQTIFFYELGGESVKKILTEKPKTIGIFIGSEGGFEGRDTRQKDPQSGNRAAYGDVDYNVSDGQLLGGIKMIGIICAMQIEADGILALCKDKKTSQKYGMTFTEGTLNGKEVVVVVCGVGKVNAAICAATLINDFKPELVINSGVAGALSPVVSIGDIVIGSKAVEHDMNVTALGDKQGEVSFPNGKVMYFECDKSASILLEKVCADIPDTKTVRGITARWRARR